MVPRGGGATIPSEQPDPETKFAPHTNMSRALDDLTAEMKIKACVLIARAAEQGIPVMIVFTGRTQAEQDELYAQGRTKPGQIVTWTRDSKHVMKAPSFKSTAIDICPYETYQLHGPDKLQWNDDDPAWAILGHIGESIGLKWGVIGSDGKRKDLGHFEYV